MTITPTSISTTFTSFTGTSTEHPQQYEMEKVVNNETTTATTSKESETIHIYLLFASCGVISVLIIFVCQVSLIIDPCCSSVKGKSLSKQK
eukprot:m.50454 g.50454  ORF g.50454 m.50454 type:complete len:91 (+) comp10671_c0_seq1:1121-1393(+)